MHHINKVSLMAISLVVFCFVTAAQEVAAQQTYTITDLGTLSGDNMSIARGINNSGQVVGTSSVIYGSPGNGRAFLYSNGEMINLGTLPGTMFSEAYGINDN